MVYAAAAAVAALALHLLLWTTGGLPPGRFSFSYAVLVGWSIITLAVFDYWNAVARRAVTVLRPATDLTDEAVLALSRRLTRMPVLAAWLALPVSAIWAVAFFAADPSFYRLVTGLAPMDALLRLIGCANMVAIVVGTMRAVWFLAIVARSNELINRIDLFMPRPLFAFSAFTVRIALGLVALTCIYSLAFPTTTNPAAYLYVIIVLGPMSIAEFILPLMGIHEMMLKEKERLQAELRGRIDKTMDAIDQTMEAASPSVQLVQAHKEYLAALFMEEDYIQKSPTWPWSPSTLRNLLAAVLLPLGIFVAQNLLERLLQL